MHSWPKMRIHHRKMHPVSEELRHLAFTQPEARLTEVGETSFRTKSPKEDIENKQLRASLIKRL